MTAVNGVDRFPAVQERPGELAGIASLVESAVLAAEYGAEPDANGMWRPGSRALYGAVGLQPELPSPCPSARSPLDRPTA